MTEIYHAKSQIELIEGALQEHPLEVGAMLPDSTYQELKARDRKRSDVKLTELRQKLAAIG